jgi:hypothetical protein
MFSLEEEILELDLLERLDSEDLCELRKYFFSGDIHAKEGQTRPRDARHKKNARTKAVQRKNYGGQPLTKRQFVKAVDKVVGKCLTGNRCTRSSNWNLGLSRRCKYRLCL